MSEYTPPQPDEYATRHDPYHTATPEAVQPSSQIPPPPPPPIELLTAPLPPSSAKLASWRQRHPVATTLIVALLIAQLVADFAAIITIQAQQTQLATLHQQLASHAAQTVTNFIHQSVTDNLNDWSKTSTHSADLAFDTNNSRHYNGDTSLIYRKTTLHDEVVWQLPGMTTFTAVTYFWVSERVSPFDLFTSADGVQWTKARPVVSTGPGGTDDWQGYLYSLTYLTNTNYVKISWNNLAGQSWSPQISQVLLSS